MGGDVAGLSGTTTSAPTATTVTDTGAPFVASALIGHIVVMTSGTVAYGVITANSTTVLTIDRWYTPNAPGGAAATTPTTGTYVVLPGQAPYWYIAVTTDSTNPSATDTTLASEITTAGSGLIRKLATFGHTLGVASYSLAVTLTGTATDQSTGAQILAKAAIFNTLTGATGRMQFETKLAQTATITATGDQVTITDTVTN